MRRHHEVPLCHTNECGHINMQTANGHSQNLTKRQLKTWRHVTIDDRWHNYAERTSGSYEVAVIVVATKEMFARSRYADPLPICRA